MQSNAIIPVRSSNFEQDQTKLVTMNRRFTELYKTFIISYIELSSQQYWSHPE